jgi:hypothetical protein
MTKISMKARWVQGHILNSLLGHSVRDSRLPTSQYSNGTQPARVYFSNESRQYFSSKGGVVRY